LGFKLGLRLGIFHFKEIPGLGLFRPLLAYYGDRTETRKFLNSLSLFGVFGNLGSY